MGTALFRRDMASEVAKHFRGTAEERLADALRVDSFALELFLAALPAGTTREEAARLARLRTHAGRRRSRVLELPRG